MNSYIQQVMSDTHGNAVLMSMLDDFCDGKITPAKGVKFGVKLRHIHDTYFSPLKDALAKAEADKAVLVKALDECVDVMETTDDANMQKAIIEALKQARAALARGKGAQDAI